MKTQHSITAASAILGDWLVLIVAMSALWSAPYLSGNLPGSDDYMRMVRVFDILNGTAAGSWQQPRLGVGGMAEIGWSRLVDWPLAATQGALEFFMARIPAAMITTTIAPAAALLIFLVAAVWYARSFAEKKESLFALAAVFFLWAMLRQFMPGRVDHHMWQIILTVLTFGALARGFFAPEKRIWSVIAGLACATGLEIGADILPWFAAGAALGGFYWFAEGGMAREKAGLVFGVCVFGGALAYHLLLMPPDRYLVRACDMLSPVWLTLAAAIPVFWSVIAALPAATKTTAARRFLSGAIIAVPLAALVYVAFGPCLHDPYMLHGALIWHIWLNQVLEAKSLTVYFKMYPAAALFFGVPVAAGLIAAAWAALSEHARAKRIFWSGFFLVMLCGAALSFYEIRTVDFAQAIAVAPLSWALARIFAKSGQAVAALHLNPKQRLAGAALVFAAGLLLFGMAAITKKEPARAHGLASCSIAKAAPVLNAIAPSLTIAAPIDAGSEILFRTHHKVLSAPYHHDQDGIIAAYQIFAAPGAAQAKMLMNRAGADMLMLCPANKPYWTSTVNRPHFFALDLFAGRVPNWLEKLPNGDSGYLIFRKKKEF